MMRRFICAVVAGLALTGCSNGSGSSGAAGVASKSGHSGSAGASASSTNAPVVSNEGAYKAGQPHVGVVINDVTQIFPRSLGWKAGALVIKGDPDAQGQFSGVRPGIRLTAPALAKTVRVAWLNNDSVVGLETIKACASGCPTLTAPAGSRYVVVQAQAADRFEVIDGATIQVQLTKVNTPANLKSDLATTTATPSS